MRWWGKSSNNQPKHTIYQTLMNYSTEVITRYVKQR
jgi:hypothetical protein